MSLAAALLYWVIVALWLAVLATVVVAFVRNPRTFGTARLLLAVVTIDTIRNIVENLYFGLYFGGKYGLFPAAIDSVLGNPNYIIIPKLMNVVAGCAVLGLLVLRWLPGAQNERAAVEEEVRKKSEALTLEIEERRRLFETSLDLILVTDRRGEYIRVSPSSQGILGYSPEELIGHNGAEFIYCEDLENIQNEMRLARRGQYIRNFEIRYVHKFGHLVSMAWSGVWSEPEQKHFFFGRDMSERKIADEKLKHLAHYDQLTGLPNRVTFQRDLEELLDPAAGGSGHHATSIAMFDLDGFKDINDTLGHSTGDQLLRAAASRMASTIKQTGRVYRLGGDEFVLVLPDCRDPIVATEIVNTILKKLGERFDVKDHKLFLGASAGIAMAPADGLTVEELVSNADLALYDAKAAGGRTCRIFVPALRANAQARRELDTELRRAWVEKEFILYFQPQLRLSDGAVVGAEALLRWRHPSRGILSPGAFIDALSDNSVALDTGRWILKTACETAASWRAKGLPAIRIGVNLFPSQFGQGTLLQDVEAALSDSGLPAAALELEITENIALSQDEAMLQPLKKLRSKGVGLAFDDFGTGFASLSYLTRYPLTRIKIDQSFVRKISDSCASGDSSLLRSIITMAHNLHLEVVAEGVETIAQEAFLRAENCEEVQGFLYAKPLPANEFEKYLRSTSIGPGHQEPDRMAG